jgi:hypothetical protein
MGEEAPETCWATHKRQVINLWNCCILLVNLFELYDDTRTYKHQINWNLHSAGILYESTPRQLGFLPPCPFTLHKPRQHHVTWEQITSHTTPYITAYLSVPSILLGLLTLGNGTSWLSRNICNILAICAV